jgi:O-methyltransferase
MRFIRIKNHLKYALGFIPYFRSWKNIGRIYFIRRYYTPFGKDQRKSAMLSAARFLHINRPIKGHYFEFGSHGGNTIRYAWRFLGQFIEGNFVAFDSFEGLPEMKDFEKSTIFKQGNLKTSITQFQKLATRRGGIPKNRLKCVKGFYAKTLNDTTARELKDEKAAVIYIDCDLYESSILALNFSRNFMQHGTILIFDDWNCYFAREDLGERRAFREFKSRENRFSFMPFFSSAEIQAFVVQDSEVS